ncbi:fungal-specific transcription factor domain-containing protein [Aspergillus egyptiacus]|nr:fungal-specific transcription factor domain-containing protein [Aspergillus egyptiacus]
MDLAPARLFRALAPTGEPSSRNLPIPRRTKRSSACIACKARRSRCSGGRPCDRCLKTGSQCVFAEEEDRRKKYAQRKLEEELAATQDLLGKIVEAFGANDIDTLGQLVSLAKERRSRQGTDEVTPGRTPHKASDSTTASSEGCIESDQQDVVMNNSTDHSLDERQGSPPSPTTSVGSLDEVNTLTEDPNRTETSRATGYIGKESEIAWMHRLQMEAEKMDRDEQQQQQQQKQKQQSEPLPQEESVTSMSYHLDKFHIAEPSPGDLRALPPKPWAIHLLTIFFQTVASSFPLLNRPLFITQFNHAYSHTGPEPTRKWLAVLNVIFAISSKYYQLSEPFHGRDVDDRRFIARAVALSSVQDLAIEHADLQQVQIDILLAIYYLACGEVNRSWHITGRAARSAVSLGLNLRVVSDQIDPVSREARTRIWWSIFSLEHLLSGMTGRSACVSYRAISVYPPLPYDEDDFEKPEVEDLLGSIPAREQRLKWTLYASGPELRARNAWFQTLQPGQALYFFYLVELDLITHAAVDAVYSLTTTKGTGQSSIPVYQEKLKTWRANLQPPFAFPDDDDDENNIDHNYFGQVSLALAYHSSQIILSRPCLTCPDVEEGTNIRFPRSRFGNDTATTCVKSAIGLIAVLPDDPSLDWLLKTTPWWCVLHFIMRALTVLLITLLVGPVASTTDPARSPSSPRTTHPQLQPAKDNTGDHPTPAILASLRKGLRWLHAMAPLDPSSRRAFLICDNFIQRIAAAKTYDMTGVPTAADLPPELDYVGRESPPLHVPVPGAAAQGQGQLRQHRPQDVHWGPDRTVSESCLEQEQEQREAAFIHDPTLVSLAGMVSSPGS